MKKVFTLLLLLPGFMAATYGQITAPAATGERMYPTAMPATVCGGQANMKSADLDWQPILISKPKAFAGSAPGQPYIDSIKALLLQSKMAYSTANSTGAKTTSVTPVMGHNFAGNTFAGVSPLDNSIAISNNGYIVSVSNSKIAFYNVSGTASYNNAITTFLPASFGATAVSNPVVLYDTRADRFIFVCQQSPIIDTGRIYICFSQSNNPGAGWWCYGLRGSPIGSGDGFDFPRIAVNDSELYVSGNLYSSPGTASSAFDKVQLYQMDKLAGYSGASLSSIYYNYFAGTPFSLLPVSSGQTAGITTGMYLLNTRNTGGSTIDLYHVIGNWCCTPFMTYTTISTTAYSLPADAQQLGTTDLLDVGDCRALNGFYLNGTIHYAFNCNAGTGFTGINYSRLNIAANTISSAVHGLTGFDYAYPSLASYTTSATDPSVIIGYGRSGSTVYPEIRAVNCDSAMAWSGSTLVKASTSYITGTSGLARWGDYTGAARKHNSANPSVWINGMFGNASHNWDTWIAEIHDATTFPCVNPDTLSVTAITTTSAVLHWNTKPGAATYNVQYRPSATTTWTNTTAATNLKSLTGLTPATHYEFQVQTRCFGTDSSAFSLSDTFTTVALPNGLPFTSVHSPSVVYPNPVTENFSVSFQLNTGSDVHITITDVNGRLVKDLFQGKAAEGMNEFSFNKANLTPGVYLLKINTDVTLIRNEKIVISR